MEVERMKISSLLARKGSSVTTITRDATVKDVVAELGSHGIGALVVSEDGVHIEGIVSERDVVRGLASSGPTLLDEKVSSIMTREVLSCGPEDDVVTLMSIMTERRIRHVPILADDCICGIVSIGDVVKIRIDELEKDQKELVEYINAR
jgi:CBS domain-containing protein